MCLTISRLHLSLSFIRCLPLSLSLSLSLPLSLSLSFSLASGGGTARLPRCLAPDTAAWLAVAAGTHSACAAAAGGGAGMGPAPVVCARDGGGGGDGNGGQTQREHGPGRGRQHRARRNGDVCYGWGRQRSGSCRELARFTGARDWHPVITRAATASLARRQPCQWCRRERRGTVAAALQRGAFAIAQSWRLARSSLHGTSSPAETPWYRQRRRRRRRKL